jgi:D-alanyl-D-alanine carboxypeptidase/D-alanyl-D-alanine-endopeptidase (penicillin-binding protein 4)
MLGMRFLGSKTLSALVISATLLAAASEVKSTHPAIHRKTPSTKPLEVRIAALLASHEAVLRGHFGYEVVDAETGTILAARGAHEYFTPASNTKLYTTAAALIRLGPDYRFHTEVIAPNRRPGDTTVSELRFVGGGDPNLSGRTIPYSVADNGGDPLDAIYRLADQIVAAHIDTVAGDIIGVDRRYAGDSYPDGWTLDDQLYNYGAPVSSLAVNDNSIHISVRATAPDELAEITLSPEVGHFTVLNQVATVPGASREIHMTRDPGSRELVVAGFIGADAPAYDDDLAVANPALFAAQALLEALRQRGISVRGIARAERLSFEAIPPGIVQGRGAQEAEWVVATRDSAPLSQAIAVVNKVSQNLHAEMLLRELGVAQGGTLKGGLDARQAFLGEAGVDHNDAVLTDGSGLARQNLTTPEATISLLRYLWHCPERDVWLATLPIGGVDGSLEHRMKGIKGADRIHAKTGSISHVATLSDYAQARSGRWLAFSLMANAEAAPPGEVRDVVDRFCALLLQQ